MPSIGAKLSVKGAACASASARPGDFTKEAAKWYALATERGDITGTYYLGRLFETGNGVPQDYSKALNLYQKAAQRGDIIAAPAMAALGHMYENGLGVEKNSQKAQEWYTKATATGYKR